MKARLIFLYLLFLAGYTAYSQELLFKEANVLRTALSASEQKVYDQISNSPSVIDATIIELRPELLKRTEPLLISHKGARTTAKLLEKDLREDQNFAWYGTLDDETGVFFTSINGQVFSKFYLGDIPCSIIPLSEKHHVLIRFDAYEVITKCGHGPGPSNKTGIIEKLIPNRPKNQPENQSYNNLNSLLVDDNCNLRVLIVFTDDADAVMNMQLIGQGLVDETNFAYLQSQVNFRMELARVVSVNYTQVNTETNQTIYNNTEPTSDDLIRLRNGTNGFENIPQLRNLYQADIVVLIREGALGANGGSVGEAYGVPNGNFAPTADNGFAIVGNANNINLIGGRFTFAHEIAHIQGARHDNDNRLPNYARGFVLNNANNSIRTILSTVNTFTCNTISDGCRIQFFSNPNVQFNGQNVGTADRDNVRRLNETANVIRNFRMTSDNLTVQSETFGQEIIANHLANQTIMTNSTVTAQSGSRLTMRAGTSVTLKVGFHAQNSSNFLAEVLSNPCTVLPNTFAIAPPLSLSQQTPAHINISPNPTSGTLNVSFNKSDKILRASSYIYDMYGRLRKTIFENQSVNQEDLQFTLDVSMLEKGLYFIKTVMNDQIITKSFVRAN